MSDEPIFPSEGTQPRRILDALLAVEGDWIVGSYFLRTLYLSQFHRAIHDLEYKFHWKGKIEHSEFTDDYGFKSYRIVQEKATLPLFAEPASLPTKQAA